MPFSCYTIGENSLLIACCELLLERGHDLRGVITSSPQVADWARQRKLRVLDADSAYETTLREARFDYLFSIAHLRLVPESVLALPAHAAINFHDGPLPAYAGLNVPVWALLNGETNHAVTWHLMTGRADAGDILKQFTFPIVDSETALSLNAKCFEAGISTFAELIDELAAGTAKHAVQDLSERRYYSGARRPAALGSIDWRSPAYEIDALVRALTFGGYDNPVATATLFHSQRPRVVAECAVVGNESNAPPGTVVALKDDQVVVATGKGDVAVRSLTELDGRPVSVAEFVQQTQLRVGENLSEMPHAVREHLTLLGKQLAKSEKCWIEQLSRVSRLDEALPMSADAVASQVGPLAEYEVSIPEAFLAAATSECQAEAVAAGFAAYLSRLSGQERIAVACTDGALQDLTEGVSPWVSTRVPVVIDIPPEATFPSVLAAWQEQRRVTREHGSWPRDLVGRTVTLRGKPELVGGRLDVLGIEVSDAGTSVDGLVELKSPQLVAPTTGNRYRLRYRTDLYEEQTIARFCNRFCEFLRQIAASAAKPLRELSVLSGQEERQILIEWNQTSTPYPRDACVHQLIEDRAARHPEAPAVVFANRTLTYGELNHRSNQLASYLRGLGVGPDRLVGVCVERSLDMVVAILAVQKAGGAYVPLDPAFPASRIALMMQDSRAPIVITQSHLVGRLPASTASIVRIDADWPTIADEPTENLEVSVQPESLAYVIYTSGSTGKPKGVMVEHRNVVNFMAGMDAHIQVDPEKQSVWLAVTSLSFDISVLELFWTLVRGLTVVLYAEKHRPQTGRTAESAMTPMRFSLFYFASDEQESTDDKYRLLVEGAKFADANGFVAVSTPERHFHAFGGLYPNPAVAGAAIATITEHVQIRAGSVVLPLHHPIRVAEEWSLVDNLSNGRVGISFASGWQPVDFVLRPENYQDRYNVLYEGIETVRQLWRGEAVSFPDAKGEMQAIRTLPRPVQKELPIWITTAGSPETWRRAGEMGANVLTHLLGQTVEEVGEKIRLYREAYRTAGHPGTGYVTIMLHTFVGDDLEQVRETVRGPMRDYLASSLSLVKNVASSWSAYKRRADGTAAQVDVDLENLSPEEMDGLLDFSFERYFETSGLFGTPQRCQELVSRLRGIGVDEIAALIDFGIESSTVLDHLEHLNRVRELAEQDATAVVPEAIPASGNQTIGALIRNEGVTHLQCTPSMASMILADDEARQALSQLSVLLIGGEAFPVGLARELRGATDAAILNMYGPTETTIWSSVAAVRGDEDSIPIGRPIANTQLYILDELLRPVPVGDVGELYIGGDGVVRGYHERPELTAVRFVENPFGGRGSRIYRTGDLARYREDGTVEFLGRVDYQVKLRGYRIELGEIETAMGEHPSLREAVVLAREDSPGDKRLVGYYVGSSVEESELREHLRSRLPEYMVPGRFMRLERFPQTPNRKIDRKALPRPEGRSAVPTVPSHADEPPSSEIEARIAKIWQDVLGIEAMGRDDNFFDIGGHSLLAIKVHRSLKDEFAKEIAITDLFRFPTIRSFAAFVNQESDTNGLDDSQQRGASRRELLMRRRGRPVQPLATSEDDGSK